MIHNKTKRSSKVISQFYNENIEYHCPSCNKFYNKLSNKVIQIKDKNYLVCKKCKKDIIGEEKTKVFENLALQVQTSP